MSKIRVDAAGKWSGGGGVVLSNAQQAVRMFPDVFDDSEAAMPLFFRNVVPLRTLLSGRFVYMPQNAWPWAGLATTAAEHARRTTLRLQSELALRRAARTLRAGPSIPAHPRAHVHCLTNPLDEGFDRALDEAGDQGADADGYFFCVGSCWGYRNLPTLLTAYQHYRGSGGRRKLLLATSGPRKSDIERQASEGVEFVQQKPNRTDLIRLMRGAQAVVFPSSVEASPITILEAAALGCRIAMSDIPGHTAALDAIDAHGALGFATFDAAQLAERLRQLDGDSTDGVASGIQTRAGREAHREQWCRQFADAMRNAA